MCPLPPSPCALCLYYPIQHLLYCIFPPCLTCSPSIHSPSLLTPSTSSLSLTYAVLLCSFSHTCMYLLSPLTCITNSYPYFINTLTPTSSVLPPSLMGTRCSEQGPHPTAHRFRGFTASGSCFSHSTSVSLQGLSHVSVLVRPQKSLFL